MDEATRNYVRVRAGNCCEYCGLDQKALAWVAFTLDHIRSKQHGGPDDPDNLAFAMASQTFISRRASASSASL
jgi:hypothetical protein